VVSAKPIDRAPRASAVATGRGDDGTTGLLFGGDRIPKDDPRTEAYGTLDEAVAALGLARAELELKRQLDVLPPALDEIAVLILRIQRELFVAGAELAADPAAWDRLRDGSTRVSAAMVAGIDAILADYEARIAFPAEFVVPGETRTSAALELGRTILRRAERRAVTVERAGLVPGPHLLPYLNRLADLLWVLARAAEQAEARPATAARTRRPRATGASGAARRARAAGASDPG
jgi:cob(I)alamin adenosyltransferase